VQEEGEFARLVTHMRKTLHVQDRVLGRIPYFNVRRTSTEWPSVWVRVMG
jgi:hypothetical protein